MKLFCFGKIFNVGIHTSNNTRELLNQLQFYWSEKEK